MLREPFYFIKRVSPKLSPDTTSYVNPFALQRFQTSMLHTAFDIRCVAICIGI